MRIGVFIQSLFQTRGGAERVAINLAKGMYERGHECVLFHDTQQDSPVTPYVIPDGIKCYNLFSGKSGEDIAYATKIIRQSHCDVLCILCYNTRSLFVLAASENLGIPLVWSEQSAPWLIENIIWNRDERLRCFASADIIHMFFSSYSKSLPEYLRKRTWIIPNFFDPYAYHVSSSPVRRIKKIILSVGNLNEPIKQHSLLISAFSILNKGFPNWECHICGDGAFHEQYSDLIDAYQLNSCVFLEGSVSDVNRWYKGAQIFCLPSRSEGFPMALLEAQAHGLPAVGFAACSGVNELIVHGYNGLLAEGMNAASLAEALATLMHDEDKRISYGIASREKAQTYSPECVLEQWEELFIAAAARKDHTTLDTLRSTLSPREYHDLFHNKMELDTDINGACAPEYKTMKRQTSHYTRARIRLDCQIRQVRKATQEKASCASEC